MSKDTNGDPKYGQPGMGSKLRDFRENSGASVEELREFMSQLRGRRPQEVLGIIAQSGLVRAMVASTVIVVLLLAVFTVGPWGYGKLMADSDAPPAKPADSAAADQDDQQPADQDSTAAAGADTATPPGGATAADSATPPTPGSGDDFLDKLGIGETKTSDPKVNPLENRADDILKDLK